MTGHRTYIDNPKLVSVFAWRPPVPKGHRAFIDPKPREGIAPVPMVKRENV